MNVLKPALVLILLSGCESKVAFGTSSHAALCELLLEYAPTASINDTEQTQREVADIGDVIDGNCK